MENPFKKAPKKESLEVSTYLVQALEEAENIIVPDDYRDDEGFLLSSPHGTRSKLENELHWKIVRTDSFKKWFGDWENDSKNSSGVVDENGEPLLTYHGTAHELKELDPDKSHHYLTLGKGVYLTPDASVSKYYGDKFYSCFINTKKVIPESTHLPEKFNILKILFYSFARPKDTALSSKFEKERSVQKALYGENIQFAVLHKENIMIIPSDIQNPHIKAKSDQLSYIRKNSKNRRVNDI